MQLIVLGKDGTLISNTTVCTRCRRAVDRAKAVRANADPDDVANAEVIVEHGGHGLRFYHSECFWEEIDEEIAEEEKEAKASTGGAV
jgi:hypothetical protein